MIDKRDNADRPMRQAMIDWLENSDHEDSRALRAYTREFIKSLEFLVGEAGQAANAYSFACGWLLKRHPDIFAKMSEAWQADPRFVPCIEKRERDSESDGHNNVAGGCDYA